METVFETPTNRDTDLLEAKEQIKQLENQITDLKKQLTESKWNLIEKESTISQIEKNMASQYVEDWTCTDIDGKAGRFSGNMYWIKGEGMLYYKNGTHFEGSWDSEGEIIDGELISNRNLEVLEKWDCGALIGGEDYEQDA